MIVITKFHEKGINQDLLYSWGFFTPYLTVSVYFSKHSQHWWVQLWNTNTYAISIAYTIKEYQRLK